MKLGDEPSKDQLTANKNKRAGGASGTAGAGSMNMPQAGRQGPYVLPTNSLIPPTSPTLVVRKDRAGGIIRDTPTFTATRGTATPPTPLAIENKVDVGSFRGTTGSWDKPALASNIQAPVVTPNLVQDNTKPSQISVPTTPVVPVPVSKETPSYITNTGGVKTLFAGGGTVSSSSPRLGNSTPEQLSDLDRILAADRDPEVAAHRLASSQASDQAYNNYLRGGLSRAEYESPTGPTQLIKKLMEAKQKGDVSGFNLYKDLLDTQLKNSALTSSKETAAQADIAKLGYNQFKDQRAFDEAHTNKLADQAISIQNKRAENTLGLLKSWHEPTSNSSEMSPGQKLQQALGTGADVRQLDADIFGSDVAAQLHNTPDRKSKLRILLGQLSPELAAAYIDNTTQ